MSRTPEQRVVSIVNLLDQAATELSFLEREMTYPVPRGQKATVSKLRKFVEAAQQMAGRDLAREFSLPSRFASEGDRVSLLADRYLSLKDDL